MKSKYELTISSNYVKDWTYLEAVREFFQNAVDENSANSTHTMSYEYDKSSEILTIENANCKLDVNTLLLGETSKSNGDYIGSFGEGYKIGILVLLREGKSVTIHNASDLWTTRLVNSKRYNSVIPVIEVQKNYNRSNKNLIVKIGNLSEDEFNTITNNNLTVKEKELNEELNIISTEYGDLLTDESEKGRIYVGGLFVFEDFELKYGYNINPKYIQLNRDRNMISSFDLIWNTSRIIANAFENNLSELFKSLNCKDTNYIDSFIKTNSKEDLSRFFAEKYGDRIPVSTQEEYNYFKDKGMNPVIVKEKVKKIVGSVRYSNNYTKYESKDSLYNNLHKLSDSLKEYVNDNGLSIYEELCDYIEDYKDELLEIKCD